MNVSNYFNALFYPILVQIKQKNIYTKLKNYYLYKKYSPLFKEIRKVIYNYYLIQYNVDTFGEENGHRYYSIDESLFVHDIKKHLYGYLV